MKTISVIVTNWNSVKLLQKYFPGVLSTSDIADEIIFADDASSDDSLKYITELQKNNPKIKLVTHKDNVGFGQNSNDAIKRSKGELVVLLNNDISPQPGYLLPSLRFFNDLKVFGVGFAEVGHENYAKLKWENGYIQHSPETSSSFHITGWVSGGSSIIRRELFIKFNGFDPVYSPYYSEDLDLCYRAWKSGYQCIWEPKCKVEHRHESTMSKFPKYTLDYVKERNRLLTVWRNITDPKMLLENRFAQLGRVLTGPNYIKIIMAAKRQLRNAKPPIVFPAITDSEIFEKFR
jgi:GT2 family glycosyltransferase